MQSFGAAMPAFTLTTSDMYCHSPFYHRGDEGSINDTRPVNLRELEESTESHQEDTVYTGRSSIYSDVKPNNLAWVTNNFQFGALSTVMGSVAMLEEDAPTKMVGVGNHGAYGNGQFEKWGNSGVAADHSRQTDISADVDGTEDRNQFHGAQPKALGVPDSIEQSKGKCGGHKLHRRLAQNREAARKSRLRKKAYVQQLEDSRLRLSKLEQELKRAREQGISSGNGLSGHRSHYAGGQGALAFDLDYAHWLDEHQRLINDLRSAVNSHLGDNELQLLVDRLMSHYDEIFRLKNLGAKSDVFHMLSGMWKTPVERCFMWLGGFRFSGLLKILGDHLEPLTDDQLVGICNLQQSSLQAEDALSHGMEALQQSIVDILSSSCLGPSGSGNVADYMGQMALAMGQLAMLENFVYQADILRHQSLHQMRRILTDRQAARAFVAINDFMSRLRALSSLWLARPNN